MNGISSSDNLFASATSMGQQFFNFNGKGISSFGELLDKVKHHPAAPRGMVTITIRNSTQGWSHSRAFYLGA